MRAHFEAQTQRYFVLDALRGVAAIVVLFFHGSLWLANRPTWVVLQNAYLAVDFFFLLSGFVIAYVYQQKLAKGHMSFWDFAIARLIRLYPMMAMGAAIGAAFFLYSARHTGITLSTWNVIALTFLCLPSASPEAAFPEAAFALNIPFWSLFLELCINLAFALTTVVAGRKTMIGALAICLIWLCFLSYPDGVSQLGWTTQTLLDGAVRATFSFLVGVTVYHTTRVISLPRLRVPLWLPITLLTLALVINWGTIIGSYFYDLFCIIILFPVIIFVFSGAEVGKIERRLSEKLGDLSYPLYATHVPLLEILTRMINNLGIASGAVLLFVLSAIIILISLVFVRVWDVPFRRFLKQRLFVHSRAAELYRSEVDKRA